MEHHIICEVIKKAMLSKVQGLYKTTSAGTRLDYIV